MIKPKPPTLRDVAAAANVSTATISKFINGAQRFTPEVEAKIAAAIKTLDYRINPLAQSMSTGKTKAVGLSILDVSNPYFTSIVKGANRVAIARGYTMLLVDTDEDMAAERSLLEALIQRVDGMLFFSRLPDEELTWCEKIDKPVIFFGRSAQLKLPSVASDDYRGAYILARYLATTGHKKIAYLGFEKARNEERLNGIRDCLATHQLDLLVYNCNNPCAQEGERLCSSIMLGAEHPDALICYNDLVALGFMKEAQALGFTVPRDISIAGFDNIEHGRYSTPELTSVDLQSEQMGAVAMEKLLNAIHGHPIKDLTTIEPSLILRTSTMRRG